MSCKMPRLLFVLITVRRASAQFAYVHETRRRFFINVHLMLCDFDSVAKVQPVCQMCELSGCWLPHAMSILLILKPVATLDSRQWRPRSTVRSPAILQRPLLLFLLHLWNYSWLLPIISQLQVTPARQT